MGKFASALKTLAVFVLGLCLFASSFVQPVQAQSPGADCRITINQVDLTGQISAVSSKKVPLLTENGQNVFHVEVYSDTGFQDYGDPIYLRFLRTNESISIGEWPGVELQRTDNPNLLRVDWTNPQPGDGFPYIDHKFIVKDGRGTYACTEKYGSLQTPYGLTLQPWYDAERSFCSSMSISPATGIVVGNTLRVTLTMPDSLLSGRDPKGFPFFYRLVLYRSGQQVSIQNIATTKTQTINFGPIDTANLPLGNYTFRIIDDANIASKEMGPIRNMEAVCAKSFCVGTSTAPGQVGGSCSTDTSPNTGKHVLESYKLCAQIANPTIQADCLRCAGGDEEANGSLEHPIKGIWTGIGCLPTNAESLIQTLIRAGLAISGGIALLMFLAAAFLLSTSSGDKKRADEAKDLMTSSVFGLLFIIFSVTILQFIGVKVLQIPGFGDTPIPPVMQQ